MNFPLKKYFVKKESWKRFGVKAGVTLVVLWAAGAAFASRYRIGIDPQQEKCLPGYTFFLIDLNDQTLERGAVYAFQAKNMQPFYKDGTRMVKILTGMRMRKLNSAFLAVLLRNFRKMCGREWFGLLIRSANCFLAKTVKMVRSASPCPLGRWCVGRNCL
ncbi:hypothetical protein MS6201_A00083 (plasmid) [Escherichia coli]|nr:hypothetical protein [Escherichia coli]